MIVTKGMGAVLKAVKNKKVNKLKKQALGVLGLGTAAATGAGALGSYMSSQRKRKMK